MRFIIFVACFLQNCIFIPRYQRYNFVVSTYGRQLKKKCTFVLPQTIFRVYKTTYGEGNYVVEYLFRDSSIFFMASDDRKSLLAFEKNTPISSPNLTSTKWTDTSGIDINSRCWRTNRSYRGVIFGYVNVDTALRERFNLTCKSIKCSNMVQLN